MPLNVVLVEPEIPPNTGNIIRLCANAGAALHLVRPLGFELDHSRMRRAGLDYHDLAQVRVHDSWTAYCDFARRNGSVPETPAQQYAVTTRGTRNAFDVSFGSNDFLVFGCETRGLSDAQRSHFTPQNRIRLPMRPDNRSLNLSNAVAVLVYEAWRQHGFAGGQLTAPGEPTDKKRGL